MKFHFFLIGILFPQSQSLDPLPALFPPIKKPGHCFLKDTAQNGYSFASSVKQKSALECQDLCKRSPGCAAFTWSSKNQNCNLKTSWYGEKKKVFGKVTGPAFCSEAKCYKTDTAIAKFRLGMWWKVHNKDTSELCQGLCQDTKGCKGFTWTRPNKRCSLHSGWDEPVKKQKVTVARRGRVSGPSFCSIKAGGVCPSPGCVRNWSYSGEKQSGCGDPGGHGAKWCPLPSGLNIKGDWVAGSRAWMWCRAPTQCVKSWKYKGVSQLHCSSVNSPGRPWCPLEDGIDPVTKEYNIKGGKFTYCTESLCVDPSSCSLPTTCATEFTYKNKTKVHCTDVDTPGKPWCPAKEAVDSNGSYRPGGKKIWCRRETCSRTPCGENARMVDEGQNRVVGGRPADPDEWPWLAALVVPGDEGAFCGGTLISDSYIVTAAHCLLHHTKDQFRVKLGEYDFSSDGETSDKTFEVASIQLHENWNEVTYENDIALLRLKKPTTFNKSIWPICLPPPGKDFSNKAGFVVGWGTIRFGGPTSRKLMEAELRVWKNEDCKENYMDIMDRDIAKSMLCASAPRKDACQGDSGGPFNCLNPSTGRWELCGIVSWGARCAEPDLPGVYTKVAHFLPWIRKKMDQREQRLIFF